MFQSAAIKQNIQSSQVAKLYYYAEYSKFISYTARLLSKIFKVYKFQSSAIKQNIRSSYVTKLSW